METTEAPTKLEQAIKIIDNRSRWAAGLSLVPVPLFDLAAITGVQLKMIQEVSEVYGAKLSDNLAKSILTSLLGGISSIAASGSLAHMVKSIPGVGPILSLATLPTLGYTSTYAVGAVFVAAFENKDPSILEDPSSLAKAISGAE